MPALVYLALAVDAPVFATLTPFGWVFFIGLASLVMAVQLVGGWLCAREV